MTQRVPDIGLEWLRARAVDDGCGCLEWGRYCIHGVYPAAKIAGRTWYVRRLLWALTRGREVPSGMDVCASCDTPLCVHPDHLVLRRPSSRSAGVPKSAHHRMATALAMRSRSKLTGEMVRDIRASDEANAVLDQRYGLFSGHVAKIRAHARWQDHSSPFARLGARGA